MVPRELRGRGLGREAFEKRIMTYVKKHPSIHMIRLMAADAGHGKSNEFWESLGFDYAYSGDNLDYESAQMMRKGVNGHPTPDPIDCDDDDT
jgi:hypothetical protein